MDDFRAVLDQLEDAQLDYVFERSRARSDAEAIREAGVPRSTFYSWPKEERDQLNEHAQHLKRRRKLAAELHLEEAAEQAAIVKVEGLESQKERIKQAAATEILDRTIGRPSQRHEVTGAGGGPVRVGLTAAVTEMSDEELEQLIRNLDEADRPEAGRDAN